MTRRPITEADHNLIRQNYQNMDDEQLAVLLDRPLSSVKNIRIRLKLSRSIPNNPYSREDMQFIKDNYTMMSDAEMADKLGRTVWAITHKRHELKLTRKQSKDRYISQRVRRMRELIAICETTHSPYILAKCKDKLRKLSGL